MLLYSSCKVMMTYLAQGLNYELGKDVDVMSFNPSAIATKIIGYKKDETSFSIISTEKAVKACFRDVGHTDVSVGTLRHEFLVNLLSILPSSLYNYLFVMSTRIGNSKIKEFNDQLKDFGNNVVELAEDVYEMKDMS